MTKDNKIVFFADATCDLPTEFVKANNIQIIGLRYYMGGEEGWFTIADNPSQFDDYYGKMRKGEHGSTSLVLYDDAIAAFEPFFKDGYDIIHFGLSSGLAKTYENANKAGIDLAKKYNRKFYAPDTKGVSAMHYLYINYILKLEEQYRNEKNCFEQIVADFDKYYGSIKAYFTVEDLQYLHRGGRLSGAALFFGSMMRIKPILTVDTQGKLANFTKKTGRLASIQFIAELALSQVDPQHQEITIIHADCKNDAEILKQKLIEKNPDIKTEITNMGFIIGTHTGPGTLGLSFKSN